MDTCKRLAATAILLVALAGPSQAAQIDYFEPIAIDVADSHPSFEAYGHRFDAQLENNDRLLTQLRVQKPTLSPKLRILRGTLSGIPDSWVRLVENDGHLEGAFSDGDEYYTVTTYGQIAKLVSVPANIPNTQTVVFRLSDSKALLPDNFCAVPGLNAEPASPYKSLVRELRAMTLQMKQLNVSFIGDSALQKQYPGNATDVMIGIANIVDGIFANQVGVLIEPSDVRLIQGFDPFVGTNPDDLLTRLSNYRVSTPAVLNQGFAYLVTGNDLNDDIVGVGYIGTLCDQAKSAALGEATFTPSIGALIAAHEFGHVFGAPHDAQSGSACAAESPNYLMNPNINYSSQFSQCSLSKMQPVIQAASCLTAGTWSDVAVAIGEPNSPPENSIPFTFPINVTSDGTIAAQNVTMNAHVDSSFLEVSATVPSGNCSLQYETLSCTLGTVNSGETRTVTVTAMSHTAQTFTFNANASADSDRLSANSQASKEFVVTQTADAAVSFSPSTVSIVTGTQGQIAVKVASVLTKPVRDVVATITSPLALQSANVAGGSCTITGTSAKCSIGSIAAGTTAQINLVGTAPSVLGFADINVSISATNDDNTLNNYASAKINVLPRRDVALSTPADTEILLVNEWKQIVVEVASIGVDPVDGVRYEFNLTGRGSELQSLTPDSGVCTGNEVFRSCSFGTMQPGTKHTITIVARGTEPERIELRSYLYATNDQQPSDNELTKSFEVRYEHDVSLVSVFASDSFETVSTWVSASLRSSGATPSQNVVVSLDVPAGIHVTSATLNGAVCTAASATRVDCALSTLAVDSTAQFTAYVIGDTAGTYTMHFSAKADGDGNPSDNAQDTQLLLRPFNDIGVKPLSSITSLTGTSLTIPITLFTGPRPIANATVYIELPNFASVESVTPSVGSCSTAQYSTCTFADLPANSEVQITARVRSDAPGYAQIRVDAYTQFDAAGTNNSQSTYVSILSPSDASIAVGLESVTAPVQTRFNFPGVTIVGTAEMPKVNVEITIPESITILSATTYPGTCTVEGSVKCEVSLVAPNYGTPISLIAIGTAPGTFSSTITLSAFNDSTPNNNSRTVTMVVAANNPPTTPPPSSPVTSSPHTSGGGGGGSADWMLLMILGSALLLRYELRGRRQRWRSI